MEQLYIPLPITPEEHENIRREVIEHLTSVAFEPFSQVKTRQHTFVSQESVLDACPSLARWVDLRFKIRPYAYRAYLTGADSRLGAHIDGGNGMPRCPFAVNFPIFGSEGTYLKWYADDVENYRALPSRSTFIDAIIPRHSWKLAEIGKHEITKPCLVKTDTFHSVENKTDHTRLMLVMRWMEVDPYTNALVRTGPTCVDEILR